MNDPEIVQEVVLDSSAILAVLLGEPGAERVLAIKSQAVASSVNLAEVQTKLVNAGMDAAIAWWHITEMKLVSVPFNDDQAREAGSLVQITRPYGLSLGDRACLALALERKAPVYTTDRAWTQLGLDLKIEVIRRIVYSAGGGDAARTAAQESGATFLFPIPYSLFPDT